jgi:hypothetical protein
MASFETVLSHIGHGLKIFFTDATKVAEVAEPIVDIMFPGIAALYNTTVTAASNAEIAAIAAGAQNGTGAQKLAMVVAAITPAFTQYATANNIPVNTTAITAYANAVVATLNALPVTAEEG